MAKTSNSVSARNRAREALAEKQKERRERDSRMEAAAARFFLAQDALSTAQREAGEAVQALLDEGESRAEISELLGIDKRELSRALAALNEKLDGAEESTMQKSDHFIDGEQDIESTHVA